MNPIIDMLGFIGLFAISFIVMSLLIKINKKINFIKLDERIKKEFEED